MRAEQDGEFQLLLQPPHELDHAALVMRVEVHQRLVEQQQARPAEQRLRQQQALALAARGLGQRPRRQLGGTHQVERPGDLAAPGRAHHRRPPAVAADRAGHVGPAAEPQGAHRAACLGHVADQRVAAPGGLLQHADRAAGRDQEAENGAQQGRLAGAVRAEQPDELAVLDREADAGENGAAAQRQRDVGEFDRAQEPDFASASSSASSWPRIHSW